MLFCARQKCLAQNWQIVGGGLSSYAGDLSIDPTTNSLYIGGAFKYADTLTCDGIVKWDGNTFTKFPSPINNYNCNCFATGAILRYSNRLFMLGYYGPYSGKEEQLFEFVNNNWVVDGTIGRHGGVSNMKIVNDRLFAFGIFDSLSGKNIQSLAVFNGIDWEPFNLPSPIVFDPLISVPSYWIKNGEFYKGQYYFGGNFHDGSYKEVIRWTGNSWMPLQTGIKGGMAEVTCMMTFKNILYVGGYFFSSDGNAADCLMAWDGQNWFNPFPQINYLNTITDLEVINDQLYISGNYIVPADNDSNMYVLARYNGCDFNIFGGICKYPEWEAQPRAIAGLNGLIYIAVADSFFHKIAKNLLSIPESTPNYKTIHISSCEKTMTDLSFSVFPNPFSDNITVQLSSDFILSETKFVITNNLGQVLFTFYPESVSQILNLSSLSSSMYFLTVQDNSNKKIVKIIKQ